jgi:hypothetical protein
VDAAAAALEARGMKPCAVDFYPSGKFRFHLTPLPTIRATTWIVNSQSSRLSMARVELKGIAKVRSKGKIYYYAWRGGPSLRGDPGSPVFMASYHEAFEDRRTPDAARFRSLVVLYKASGDYKKLADTTKAQLVTVARPYL